MFGGLVSNAKFQCLGMIWGCCDNGLKERQRMGWRRGRDGSCAGDRKKNFDSLFGYSDFYQNIGWAKNSGRVVKYFKGKIVFLLFGEVSK